PDLIDPDCGRPLRYLTPVYSSRDVDDSTEVDGGERHAPVPFEHNAGTPEFAPEPTALPGPETPIAVTAEDEHDLDDEQRPPQAPAKDQRGKRPLPSWDDVLLRVRRNGRA